MTKTIEIISKPRAWLLNFISDLSIEQLNKVPAGFNNNIIWNLGHMVAAQQGICYRRAGVDTIVTPEFMDTYGSNTKPEKFLDEAELETIKELFITTLDQFVIDHRKNLFSDYIPWTTRYGVDMTNIDDAVQFLPFHEGLHVGYVMAQKRAILQGL